MSRSDEQWGGRRLGGEPSLWDLRAVNYRVSSLYGEERYDLVDAEGRLVPGLKVFRSSARLQEKLLRLD